MALSDETGAEGDIYTYDSHGVPDSWTGNRIRFTGRWMDHETGLYYYRARFYSPGLGRFLQTDPIGYGDNMNMYAYVGGDPVNLIDPSGEETQIRMLAYRLRGMPGLLGQGHAYIEYTDTETGESRISRGGPGVLGDGGNRYGFLHVSDDLAAGSIDTNEVNGRGLTVEVISDVTISDEFSDVKSSLQGFRDFVNGAYSPYHVTDNNSNTYAGDAFEFVTGNDAPENESGLGLPGYANDLENIIAPDEMPEREIEEEAMR